MMLRLLPCLLFQGLLYNIPRWENCQCTHQALERVHRASGFLLENWRLDLLINWRLDLLINCSVVVMVHQNGCNCPVACKAFKAIQ
jgi:hypothetical protein